MRKSLENYIHNLWHWLKMTPCQYAECCGTEDPEPYMFPEWETSLDKGTQRKTTENELPSLTQCTA